MRLLTAPVAAVLALLVACDGQGGLSDPYSEPAPTFTIIGRAPTPGHAGVPVTASITLTFSTNIDPSTVQLGSVTLNGAGFGTLAVNGNVLKLTPAAPMVPGVSYEVATSPTIAGLDGVPLGPTPTWGFKTAGVPPAPDTVLAARQRPR